MREATKRQVAVDDVLNTAATGINYWCYQFTPEYVPGVRDSQGYKMMSAVTIGPSEECKDDFQPKRITDTNLVAAAMLCANPDVDVNMDTRKRLALWGLQVELGYEVDVDYDAEDAVCLVQLAMFGKLVYG